MIVSGINPYNSYKVAKKIVQIKHKSAMAKTACIKSYKKARPKQFLPSIVMLAQSFFHLNPTPKAMKLQSFAPEAIKPQVVASTIKSLPKIVPTPDSNFTKIQGMVRTVLPESSNNFIKQIVEASKAINCKPEDLTALLFKESHFDPSARRGSFYGIGQMGQMALDMSIDYAKAHKEFSKNIKSSMSLPKFAKLSKEEQLPYVRNFVLSVRETYVEDSTKTLTGGELYALFLTPNNINSKFLAAANDAKTGRYYRQNSGLDFNKDKRITKHDLQRVLNDIKQNDLNPKVVMSSTTSTQTSKAEL